MNLTKQVRGWLQKQNHISAEASDVEVTAAFKKCVGDGTLTPEILEGLSAADAGEQPSDAMKTIEAIVAKQVEAKVKSVQTETPTPAQVLGGEGGTRVRVKSPLEGYNASRTNLFYPTNHKSFPGRPAMWENRQLESSSQADLAVCGSFFKFAAAAGSMGRPLPRALKMTEHDKQIMDYALHEMPWTGIINGDGSETMGAMKVNGKLSDFQIKALLDDSTSGGLEAAPIVFDSAVITIPVLYGELYPLVNTVPIARGRRIEGFSISNPTFTSGTAEGTSIGVLDTTGFIAAFDTTVYNAVGAMEIGNDFMEDSPVDIGAIVTQKYGEKAQEWLDNQIANGDGTTEPTGLVNSTSGATDIGNPAGGANAAPQTVDFEKLLFGVSKVYRNPADKSRCVFVMNDTSYQRARSIATATGWQTRAHGMDEESYMLLGHSVKIQNDIANTWACFSNLKYYRMYRRLGLTVRVETAGETLALKNLTAIIVRMRWGGKMETGSAMAYSDNWQT